MVISLVINQANPMPTSRFKKVSQNPCDSLRDVVYVDVLSIVRDKMSRWTHLPTFIMDPREYDICPFR